jgi:hypothetical protein
VETAALVGLVPVVLAEGLEQAFCPLAQVCLETGHRQ